MCTAEELAQAQGKATDPLAGPINADNERQAVQTLEAALAGMLEPLQRAPLLAGDAPQQEQQGQREQPPGEQQHDAAERPQTAEVEQQPAANENGFDADWRMSRHFCRLYLEGQRAILQRSLQECRALLAAL